MNESESVKAARALLAEAIEDMEHIPAAPGSWLARVREYLDQE